MTVIRTGTPPPKPLAPGKLLRVWMAMRRYRRRALARDLGISVGHLDHLLGGTRYPSAELQKQIALVVGVPPARWAENAAELRRTATTLAHTRRAEKRRARRKEGR